MIKMKQCIKCHKTTDLSNFGRDKNRIDGYKLWCLDCCADFTKVRYENMLKKKEARKTLFKEQEQSKRHPQYHHTYVKYQPSQPRQIAIGNTAMDAHSFGSFIQMEDQLAEMNKKIDEKLKECMFLRSKRLSLMQRLGMLQ